MTGSPVGAIIRNINSYAQMRHRAELSGNVGGGYAVSSTLGARKPENKALNDKNIEATHQPAYTGDSDPDYVVEPTAEADLHFGGLYQIRRGHMIYPIKDSHSSLRGYDHMNHTWSKEQFDASDEVQYVNITKALHADTLEHLDLKDGRTGVPTVVANETAATDATAAADGAAAALYQRRRYNGNPYLDFSQIYRVTNSSSYIKPYEVRDHSWSDNQYEAADEVAWLGNTNTLHADYLENLQPTAEYHLVGGRTGVAEEAEDEA